MIDRFLTFIPGVGERTGVKLNKQGIRTWEDLLHSNKPAGISGSRWDHYQSGAKILSDYLIDNNMLGLSNYVPKGQDWLLIPYLNQKIAYLDIETTGLSPRYHQITTIAVYDGHKIYDFIHGENLDEFGDFISQYPVMATFYGKGFDVPFMKAQLGLDFPQIHFDLCFILRKLGLKGGLKAIEKHVGISRGELDGVDGYFAVKLWKKYKQTGDRGYLNTLLAYNNEDVINLEYLLVYAYNNLVKKFGFSLPKLQWAENNILSPYTADLGILKKMGIRKTSRFY